MRQVCEKANGKERDDVAAHAIAAVYPTQRAIKKARDAKYVPLYCIVFLILIIACSSKERDKAAQFFVQLTFDVCCL